MSSILDAVNKDAERAGKVPLGGSSAGGANAGGSGPRLRRFLPVVAVVLVGLAVGALASRIFGGAQSEPESLLTDKVAGRAASSHATAGRVVARAERGKRKTDPAVAAARRGSRERRTDAAGVRGKGKASKPGHRATAKGAGVEIADKGGNSEAGQRAKIAPPAVAGSVVSAAASPQVVAAAPPAVAKPPAVVAAVPAGVVAEPTPQAQPDLGVPAPFVGEQPANTDETHTPAAAPEPEPAAVSAVAPVPAPRVAVAPPAVVVAPLPVSVPVRGPEAAIVPPPATIAGARVPGANPQPTVPTVKPGALTPTVVAVLPAAPQTGAPPAPTVPAVAPVPAASEVPAAEPGESAGVAESAVSEAAPASTETVVVERPAGAPEVSLMFVLWARNPDERMASIRVGTGSVTIIHEGQFLEGMQVSAIHSDAVDFLWTGSTFRVRVRPF